MRKAILSTIRRRLAESLQVLFPRVEDISDTREFAGGHFGFLLDDRQGINFFLSLVAHDERDSFRLNFAWNITRVYPTNPYSNLRANIEEYVLHDVAECQLAVLRPEEIPWEWHVDEAYANWLAEIEVLQGRLAQQDDTVQREYLVLLQKKPKAISANVAGTRIDEICNQLRNILVDYVLPFMNRVASQSALNKQS